MATVSSTFTAVGQSAVLDVPSLGEDITISLSGGATATVLLEREKVPYAGVWQTIRTYYGNVEASFRQERKNERYRFNCVSYTSGTVTYSVSDGDLAVDADSVITTTQGGATVTGTLSVTGALSDGAASTLTTGATVGTLTLADGSITDSSGAISFGDEDFSTTGTVATGAVTTTGATSATTTSTATDGFIGANVICTDNVGSTPGTVTAVEYGDGYNHLTVLTVTAAVLVPDIPSDAEELGALIYTFPAGVHRVNMTHMKITAASVATDAGNADLGCGSTLAAGDGVTLQASTDEDFIDGQTVADMTSPSVELTQTGDGTIFAAADSKLFHINVSATWTGTNADPSITGTVTIAWTYMGA